VTKRAEARRGSKGMVACWERGGPRGTHKHPRSAPPVDRLLTTFARLFYISTVRNSNGEHANIAIPIHTRVTQRANIENHPAQPRSIGLVFGRSPHAY